MTNKLLWRGDCMEFMGVEFHETYFEAAKKRFLQKTLDNGFS